MENLLTSGGSAGTLAYDPAMRLHQISGPGYRFGYDGIDLIGEYNNDGVLIGRYVHGPGPCAVQ